MGVRSVISILHGIGAVMDTELIQAFLNGEYECSAEEYDMAVSDAVKLIDLLVEVGKLVNDPTSESTYTVEKIRTKLNKEVKGSNERYVYEW